MEKQESNLELKTIYFEITDLWKTLCELHSQLLEKSFDEYTCLLNSEVEKLETVVNNKENIILEINIIEKERASLISKLMNLTNNHQVNHFDDLIDILNSSVEEERKNKHLLRFNSLLIDIIEKIQVQNKKNQLFLNKALLSLKTIRDEFSGKSNYQTYSHKGARITTTRV